MKCSGDSEPLAKEWVVGEKSAVAPPAAVAQSVRLVDLGSAPRNKPNHRTAERTLCLWAHFSITLYLKRSQFPPRDLICSGSNVTFLKEQILLQTNTCIAANLLALNLLARSSVENVAIIGWQFVDFP